MFRLTLAIMAMAAAGFLTLWQIRVIRGEVPAAAIAVPCRVIEVVDGDTVTVEVTLRMRVRLKDCWAPELREEGGPESRDHMRRLALDQDAVLLVDLEGARRLDDVFTFGRIVGSIYVDGKDASQQQIEAGHAFERRQKQ